MSQGAGAPPGAAGAGAEKTVKEYVLKSAPSAAVPQMFHVARFSTPNFDFTKLNQPTHMFRSQDIDKPPPEDGKEIVPKPVSRSLATKDPERYRHVPWMLEDSANEHNERPHQFHGGLDGGQSGKYAVFLMQGQELRVLPVTEWYHFKPRIQIRNAEAAERQNALNRAKLEERVRRVTKKLDENAPEQKEHDDDDLKAEAAEDEERAARYSQEAKTDVKKKAVQAKREKVLEEDEAGAGEDDKIDFEEVVSDDDEEFADAVADDANEAEAPKEKKLGSLSDEEKPLSASGKEMDSILRKLQKDDNDEEEEEEEEESVSGSESEEQDEEKQPMETSPPQKPAAADTKPDILPVEVHEELPTVVKKEKKRKDEAEEDRPLKKARPVEVKKEAQPVKAEPRSGPNPFDITDNEFKQAFANAPGNKLTMKALVAKFKSRITAHPEQKTRFSLLVKRYTRAMKQGDETFVLLK